MSKAMRNANKVEHKQHEDGKQIANLEQAVHRLKQQVENQVNGKEKNYSGTLGKVVALMGSKEKFEARYLLTLGDCEIFAGRVPPGISTGYVPVALYRKTVYGEVVTGTNGNGYICIADDGWGYGQYSLLAAPGTVTYPVSYTGSPGFSYSTILGSNAAMAATGCYNGGMQDVSADFVSDANDGTEYMQVASITTLTAEMTPNAAADAAYVGRAHVIFTLDPERYPLNGSSLDNLKQAASSQDAQVFIRTFQITRDGLFVPEDREDFLITEEGPTRAYASISSIAIPVHNDSFLWQRIGAKTLSSVATNFVTRPSQCIWIESPTGTKYQTRTTYLWQTEEYPTNRVEAFSSSTSELGHASTGYPTKPTYGMSGGVMQQAPPTMRKRRNRDRLMLNVASGHALEIGKPGPGTKTARTKNSPAKAKPKRRLAGSTNPSKPEDAMSEERPSSLGKFVPHVFRNLGSKTHPAAPALSVFADRSAEVPGFHSMAASNPMAALKDFLPINELTKSICGQRGGPSAVEAIDSEPAWWESLLSGASTAASFIGPLLALL